MVARTTNGTLFAPIFLAFHLARSTHTPRCAQRSRGLEDTRAPHHCVVSGLTACLRMSHGQLHPGMLRAVVPELQADRTATVVSILARRQMEEVAVSIETDDREVLRAAEQNARRALSTARDEVEHMLHAACRDSVALLLEQQQMAANLLFTERDDAVQCAATNGGAAEGLPDPQREISLKYHEWDAETLLATQQRAAEALVAAEKKSARMLHDAVEHATTNALMKGQREAAAALLEAGMRVETARATPANPTR